MSAALIPAAFVGKALGTRLLRSITERAFRLVALGVTALTGALGTLTALWALL